MLNQIKHQGYYRLCHKVYPTCFQRTKGDNLQQENVPQEDILSMLRNQLGGDNQQSQRLFDEGTRLLQERTGKEGLFDNIMQNSKKSSF